MSDSRYFPPSSLPIPNALGAEVFPRREPQHLSPTSHPYSAAFFWNSHRTDPAKNHWPKALFLTPCSKRLDSHYPAPFCLHNRRQGLTSNLDTSAGILMSFFLSPNLAPQIFSSPELVPQFELPPAMATPSSLLSKLGFFTLASVTPRSPRSRLNDFSFHQRHSLQ
jgi:hypothetical protein